MAKEKTSTQLRQEADTQDAVALCDLTKAALKGGYYENAIAHAEALAAVAVRLRPVAAAVPAEASDGK